MRGSSAPGLVDLQIGNQFTDYILVDVAVQNAVSHVSVVTLGSVPAAFSSMRLYVQCALMDNTFFPLHASDVWFTDY